MSRQNNTFQDEKISSNFILNEYDYIILINISNKKVIDSVGPDYIKKSININNEYYYVMQRILNYNYHPEDFAKLNDKILLENICGKLTNNKFYDIQYETESEALDVHVKLLRYRYYDDNKEYLYLCSKDVTDISQAHAFEKHKLTVALSETQRANDSKTEFLSRMSHDMRTPLNGIIGLSDLALKEENIETVKKYLSDIYLSGKFLLSLINDVLDMSQMDNKKLKLSEDIYYLKEFVDNCKSIMASVCEKKHQTFVVYFDKNLPAAIICDKVRLNQIFVNLLSNANKYTNEGGTISLTIRQYYAGKQTHVGIRFEVADNGVGMQKEFVERAYEPFNREERGATAVTEGNGLGLTIVNSLIELMNGTVKIDSKPNVGTRVIVHLIFPIAPTDDPVFITEELNSGDSLKPCIINIKEEKTDKYDALNGKRVLIAEDNDVNLLIEVKLLQKLGINVEIAKNGQKAIELFMENELGYFDAILMDIRMPIMDGISATKTIRNLSRQDAHHIPIIAITANAFKDDMKQCIESGMDSHISKPIEPKKLYDVLYNFIIQNENI